MFKVTKLLSGLLAVMLVVLLLPVNVKAAGNTLTVGTGGTYATLSAAYDAATAGDTIQLVSDVKGQGIVVKKAVVFDFNGYTYEVNTTPLAGSTGTQTQCFQLLKEAGSVTFKNGTLYTAFADVRVMIMNYCDLTLDNFTINHSCSAMNYGVSNNNGHSVLTGNTNILGAYTDFALDVWRSKYYGDVSVTINTTGTIEGEIEIGKGSGTEEASAPVLSLQNVNHEGALTVSDGEVTVTGGTYTDANVQNYASETMRQENGKWVFGEAPVAEPSRTSSAAVACDHVMDYVVTKDATDKEDGVITYKCTKCSHAELSIPVCGQGAFLKNAANSIKNAAAGANVVIKTDRWVSFNQEVLEAIKAKPGVTITVDYLYKGSLRSFTVAGGTDLTPYMTNGFCGFEYIVYQLAVAAMQ